MTELTRSQHPDLRMFTQVSGKLAWYSNRSYKTLKGCEKFRNDVLQAINGKYRGIEYKIIVDVYGEYRVLAKPVKKAVSQ